MAQRLIDADVVIKHIEEYWEMVKRGKPSRGMTAVMQSIKTIVNSLQTVDAEPHWIPCSEHMPDSMEPVNITWVNHEPESYYMSIKDKPFTATGIYYKGKWYWWSSTCDDILCEYGENEIDEVADGIEIVAWMPLPEPYEVEE